MLFLVLVDSFTNPPILIFQKVGKKLISKNFCLFYPPKNCLFLRFCLCIFESDTIKIDCPVEIFRKMMKYLKI